MTFLAIDIGNTRLKWAQYEAPSPTARVIAHGAEFLDNIGKLAEAIGRTGLHDVRVLTATPSPSDVE